MGLVFAMLAHYTPQRLVSVLTVLACKLARQAIGVKGNRAKQWAETQPYLQKMRFLQRRNIRGKIVDIGISHWLGYRPHDG